MRLEQNVAAGVVSMVVGRGREMAISVCWLKVFVMRATVTSAISETHCTRGNETLCVPSDLGYGGAEAVSVG